MKYPINVKEAEIHMTQYIATGLSSSLDSMYACRVIMENCSYWLTYNHFGGKSTLACRSYNLTSNSLILYKTPGHSARCNDKTKVLFDEFARKLQNKEIMNGNFFESLEQNGNGEIVAIKYCGT